VGELQGERKEEHEDQSTLLNSSKSERAMQASQALLGSQLSVFSSPSLRGPLGTIIVIDVFDVERCNRKRYEITVASN
jgi:hypothetical protein